MNFSRPLRSPILAAFAIVFWWLIAFKSPEADEPHYNILQEQTTEDVSSAKHNVIAIDRPALVKALKGDTTLMGKLILEWDLDAEIIEYRFNKPVKRLQKDALIRSQILTRMICRSDDEELANLNEKYRKKLLIDDIGYPINLETPRLTFLPQTYMAAEILLSLADPSQITALPAGLRRQSILFSREELDLIPMNIDRYSSEKLYLASPDIALVAFGFSHPSSIEAMKKQGIELFTTGEITDFEDIKRVVGQIGHLANQPLKGELLAIFMEAALNAIDNKRTLELENTEEQRVLIVNYHTRFSLPGKKTLTSAFIKRMGLQAQLQLNSQLGKDLDWSIPLFEEQIHAFDPTHLLIIASDTAESRQYFMSIPALQKTEARLRNAIHVLDHQVQGSVSHQFVLAYYDLNNALVKLDE